MKVLADRHHSSLFYSLKMLFEDRLGWELYFPVGLDWYDRGYWNYTSNNDPGVINQMLIGYPNEIQWRGEKDGYVEIDEMMHGYIQKGLTFEQFLNTDIDIIIASIPAHEALFDKLIKDHKPNAKLIRHEGNTGGVFLGIAKNAMVSVEPECITIPDGIHTVFYHQEFDTKVFSKEPLKNNNKVVSNMNCLPQFPGPYEDWNKYKELLPEFSFEMHGIAGEQGNIDRIDNLANAIKESTFVWQTKPGERCGGHTTRNAMACGRPIITRRSYLDVLFNQGILEDGVTCIDLDARSAEDNASVIKSLSKKASSMGNELYRRWHALSDFDKEEIRIRNFLENLD